MTALLKTIALGTLAVSLMAQRPGPRASATRPDPATMAQNMSQNMLQNKVTRLTTLLDLTTAQASEATTIFSSSAAAINPLRVLLDTDRKTLETAVATNSLAVIDRLAASVGTLTGQITAIQSKADAAFYSILTPAQQAKLSELGGLGGRGGFGGPGGRGRGGPPKGRP